MPKAKYPLPDTSDAEEAAINSGIARDPDSPEVTAAEFATMRPASEVLPPELYAALTRGPRTGASGASSVIADVSYDAWRERLDVTFKDSGRTYSYFGVPEHLYQALMKAPSKEVFFNDRIKNKYSSQDDRTLSR